MFPVKFAKFLRTYFEEHPPTAAPLKLNIPSLGFFLFFTFFAKFIPRQFGISCIKKLKQNLNWKIWIIGRKLGWEFPIREQLVKLARITTTTTKTYRHEYCCNSFCVNPLCWYFLKTLKKLFQIYWNLHKLWIWLSATTILVQVKMNQWINEWIMES